MKHNPNGTSNMVTGNSLKLIVSFFLPLLWGNLFQQIYSIVDSIIVGKGISDKALAAVGATGTLNFLILGFVVGMTRGFGVLFAQSFGKDDIAMLQSHIKSAKRLCITISIIFTLICIVFLRSLLTFMSTPADIFDDAYNYFVIILAGIFITVMNNLAITILQSLGDSKTPLYAMIISSIVNIILDIILVMVLGSGVSGAAIATVFSQIVSYYYCLRQMKKLVILEFSSETIDTTPELLKIGLPVAFMNSITASGAMILQYFVNLMGSSYVAAYSACMRFAGLFEQFGASVGLAIMTFVGQNMGAKKYHRIRKGVFEGILLSCVVNLPLAALQIFFPKALAGMLLSDPLIISYCAEFLPILGIALFPLGWLFIYRYAVQGIGNTFLPMLSGFLEVLLRFSFCMTLGKLSFRGIAISEVSAWIGAFIMLMITYFVLMHELQK